MQLQEKPTKAGTQNYHDLNAMLNLLGEDGKIQFDKDKEAAQQFFLQHVNQNTVFFHDLKEKLDYLVENNYYDEAVMNQYSFEFIKSLFKQAYGKKFRFKTFMGAFKYYKGYTLKTFDGERYLERFEDRVCMTVLYLSRGNESFAMELVEEIITNRYQPATPTFLNAGKKQRGEMVSCFLLRMEDNMESIGRAINAALQLSKRGGGVAFGMSNIREAGAPIKHVEDASSGIIPIMKLFEDSFSYADQLGARDGAGAVYLTVHHFDFEAILDTKRENADEKVRIKTLSIGSVVTDAFMNAAKNNEDFYQFSAYDVERVYGIPFGDMNITERYEELIANPNIKKKHLNARELLQRIAEIQPQSGYPYILFSDTANDANPNEGWINMSNLCSEILQTNTASVYNDDLSYKTLGRDISCNLGSINIALAMDNAPNFGHTVEVCHRALTAVSDMTSIDSVPSIREGNDKSHSVGLGQMNLHGFFGKNRIMYGSIESLDFTDLYFATVNYYSILASCKIAEEKGEYYDGFEKSTYATGEYFEKYISGHWIPRTAKVAELFEEKGFYVPTNADWARLAERVKASGLYNSYRLAVPPTGSISYLNNSTSSIHPIVAKIEVRKEGKIGRVCYPAAFMTNDNLEYYQDAYEIGAFAVIDVYAEATKHTDQGLSLTAMFEAHATTRDINRAQIYAFKKKIKTMYYIRMRQDALEGTEVEGCVSCSL